MYIGCCVNMLPKEQGDPGLSYAPAIKRAGFDYIELPIAQIITLSEAQFESSRALLRDLSLPVRATNNFFAPDVRLIGPKADKGLVRARYTHALEWAARLGAKYAVFGSPWAKLRPEDISEEQAFEELAAWCAEFGDEAAKQGLTVAIEPNNRTETNTINTFSQAVELAKAVNHPNVRCLQDYFHLGMERDSVDSVLEYGKDWLVHTHFARIEKRGFPRSMSEDPGYADFFNALRAVSYDGGVSMEGFPLSRESFPEEAAATCAFLRAAANL